MKPFPPEYTILTAAVCVPTGLTRGREQSEGNQGISSTTAVMTAVCVSKPITVTPCREGRNAQMKSGHRPFLLLEVLTAFIHAMRSIESQKKKREKNAARKETGGERYLCVRYQCGKQVSVCVCTSTHCHLYIHRANKSQHAASSPAQPTGKSLLCSALQFCPQAKKNICALSKHLTRDRTHLTHSHSEAQATPTPAIHVPNRNNTCNMPHGEPTWCVCESYT